MAHAVAKKADTRTATRAAGGKESVAPERLSLSTRDVVAAAGVPLSQIHYLRLQAGDGAGAVRNTSTPGS